jgi:hypothetical protein
MQCNIAMKGSLTLIELSVEMRLLFYTADVMESRKFKGITIQV